MAAAVVLAMVAASVMRVDRVTQRTTGAQLLWSASEAYLFVGTTELGWRLRAVMMPLAVLAPWGLPVTDSDHAVTVFRIGPERVDRHVAEHLTMGLFGVLDGRITSGVWRWERDHFEAATVAEARVRNDPEFSNVNGWSKRTLPLGSSPSSGWTVPFAIGGQSAALIVHGGARAPTTIDLQRGNGPLDRLWSLDERPRSVDQAEYEALFKR